MNLICEENVDKVLERQPRDYRLGQTDTGGEAQLSHLPE